MSTRHALPVIILGVVYAFAPTLSLSHLIEQDGLNEPCMLTSKPLLMLVRLLSLGYGRCPEMLHLFHLGGHFEIDPTLLIQRDTQLDISEHCYNAVVTWTTLHHRSIP